MSILKKHFKERVVCIVQARMGSTRLPGKILMTIAGKPMLWHVVNQTRKSKFIDHVVVATTTQLQDDQTEKFCQNNNFSVFRGKEDDVLDRFYQAAVMFKADVIVRITADCPLIDPDVVDQVIKYFIAHRKTADYASNIIKRTFPRGLDTEVFSFEALEKAWRKADKPYEREHVTPFLYEHPKLFRLAHFEGEKDWSHLRWTVDEEKDLEFVREVYEKLTFPKNVSLNEILSLLEKEPRLVEINRFVNQKKLPI